MLVPEGVDLALHPCEAFGEGLSVAPRFHPAAHRPELPPHGDQTGERRQDAGDGGEDRGHVLHYWAPPPVVGAGAGAGSWATWAAAAAAGSSLGSCAGDGDAGASASVSGVCAGASECLPF